MQYEPTGKHEIRMYFNDSFECLCPVVVGPDGKEIARFDDSIIGRSEAEQYCYEMNHQCR